MEQQKETSKEEKGKSKKGFYVGVICLVIAVVIWALLKILT